MTFINKLRGLRFVFRWNFVPTLHKENVAEHSYWTAVFALILAERSAHMDHFGPTLVRALFHDAEEAVTGDLPVLVKRMLPEWERIEQAAQGELFPEHEHDHGIPTIRGQGNELIVSVADIFASLMFAKEEYNSGNKYFARIVNELIDGIVKQSSKRIALERAAKGLLFELGFDHKEAKAWPNEMSHF